MPEVKFPCPEDILSMPKTSCGHFCSGCNKEVIDFRNASDEKIQAHLAKSKSTTCGIFNSTQLTAPIQNTVSSLFRIAFTAVFLLGIGTADLHAQTETDTLQTNSIVQEGFQIYGSVKDEAGEPVIFAKVYITINGVFNTAVASDIEGRYKLTVHNGLKGDTLTLNARSIGLEPHAYTNIVIGDAPVILDITMKEAESQITTGIIIVGTPPILSRDPYDAGKTVITAEDIKHRAR